MPESPTPESYIALGTVAGAVLTKIGSVLIRRHFSEAAEIRKELRASLAKQGEEIKQLRAEVDTWRVKYYAQFEEIIQLRTELREMRTRSGFDSDAVAPPN